MERGFSVALFGAGVQQKPAFERRPGQKPRKKMWGPGFLRARGAGRDEKGGEEGSRGGSFGGAGEVGCRCGSPERGNEGRGIRIEGRRGGEGGVNEGVGGTAVVGRLGVGLADPRAAFSRKQGGDRGCDYLGVKPNGETL